MITLFELFKCYGLDDNNEVKLYRNKNQTGVSAEELHSRNKLDEHNSVHDKHKLGDGLLATFIGEENRLSRFVGMQRIISKTTCDLTSNIRYEMKKRHCFDPLKDRLVIRWPPGQINHRWLVKPNKQIINFEIHSIRAIGLSKTFPGFNELIISHADLVRLVTLGDGGSGWIEALRSTRGVYLITDTVSCSGGLYVGSATGADGIWGRWQDYGNNGHGGNHILKKRCRSDSKFHDGLQYSILETLGNLATNRDGLHAEQRWKNKLGKKATTLNAN